MGLLLMLPFDLKGGICLHVVIFLTFKLPSYNQTANIV